MAVYLRQRHKARSIGSEPASARDDYATAVSPPLCLHEVGSLNRLEMSQVQALFGEPKRKDHAKRGLFFLLLNQDEPASAQKRYATAVSPLMCLRKISQSEDSSPVFAFFLVGLDRPPLRKVENG